MLSISLGFITIALVIGVITTSLKIGFGIVGFTLKLIFSKPVIFGVLLYVGLNYVGVV